MFLPQRFPSSVSCDYLAYQRWDTAQALCSYITGTLATQAVLKGYGVGSQDASAAAATITWIMRDICSHVGTIVFVWAEGSDFDNNCKQWRLVADIFNDLAIFMELVMINQILLGLTFSSRSRSLASSRIYFFFWFVYRPSCGPLWVLLAAPHGTRSRITRFPSLISPPSLFHNTHPPTPIESYCTI